MFLSLPSLHFDYLVCLLFRSTLGIIIFSTGLVLKSDRILLVVFDNNNMYDFREIKDVGIALVHKVHIQGGCDNTATLQL